MVNRVGLTTDHSQGKYGRRTLPVHPVFVGLFLCVGEEMTTHGANRTTWNVGAGATNPGVYVCIYWENGLHIQADAIRLGVPRRFDPGRGMRLPVTTGGSFFVAGKRSGQTIVGGTDFPATGQLPLGVSCTELLDRFYEIQELSARKVV